MDFVSVLACPPSWYILPIIPEFQKKSCELILIDAPAIEESGGSAIGTIFRLKHSCISFTTKEAPVRRIERITIEPSIIAIVMKESRKVDENLLQAYENALLLSHLSES